MALRNAYAGQTMHMTQKNSRVWISSRRGAKRSFSLCVSLDLLYFAITVISRATQTIGHFLGCYFGAIYGGDEEGGETGRNCGTLSVIGFIYHYTPLVGRIELAIFGRASKLLFLGLRRWGNMMGNMWAILLARNVWRSLKRLYSKYVLMRYACLGRLSSGLGRNST
jgi:hypothetical protein